MDREELSATHMEPEEADKHVQTVGNASEQAVDAEHIDKGLRIGKPAAIFKLILSVT